MLDETYKILPKINKIKALVLLLDFNFSKNLYLLCLLITLGDETEETYDKPYKFININFGFYPKYITCDFMKSNLNAIKITHIITCFFHLIQSCWRKANKFHLRNKNYKENTKELIANLKLLPFLDNKNMKLFYNEIKKQNKFKDEFFWFIF